jgi:hypothetical protein
MARQYLLKDMIPNCSMKMKRKKPVNPGSTKQEFDQGLPETNTIYPQWGAKCHVLRNHGGEDTEVQPVQQLAPSNKDIEVASQQR